MISTKIMFKPTYSKTQSSERTLRWSFLWLFSPISSILGLIVIYISSPFWRQPCRSDSLLAALGWRAWSLLSCSGCIFQEDSHVQQGALYSLGEPGRVGLLTAVEGCDGHVNVLIHGIVTHSVAVGHHWTEAHDTVRLWAHLTKEQQIWLMKPNTFTIPLFRHTEMLTPLRRKINYFHSFKVCYFRKLLVGGIMRPYNGDLIKLSGPRLPVQVSVTIPEPAGTFGTPRKGVAS